MMTSEARPPGVDAEPVPYGRLRRANAHRTSPPTNEAVREVCWQLEVARGGRAPYIDAVFMAALAVAGVTFAADGSAVVDPRTLARLRREVERIESGVFVLPPPREGRGS